MIKLRTMSISSAKIGKRSSKSSSRKREPDKQELIPSLHLVPLLNWPVLQASPKMVRIKNRAKMLFFPAINHPQTLQNNRRKEGLSRTIMEIRTRKKKSLEMPFSFVCFTLKSTRNRRLRKVSGRRQRKLTHLSTKSTIKWTKRRVLNNRTTNLLPQKRQMQLLMKPKRVVE